jgi:hypothetical protein
MRDRAAVAGSGLITFTKYGAWHKVDATTALSSAALRYAA